MNIIFDKIKKIKTRVTFIFHARFKIKKEKEDGSSFSVIFIYLTVRRVLHNK
jgi:hypothetical protein